MLRRFLLPVLLLAGLAAAQPALAAYPDKPIRLIVPSAPGGAPDALMRALGQQLSTQMGVPVVIDNKPGGSYVIGTMDLVKSPPAHSHEQTLDIWLAPSHEWYPVRLRFTDNDGEVIEQTLDKIVKK